MTADRMSTTGTKGLVIHAEARYYDLQAWLLTRGRERAFRERLVALVRLEPGEATLDVGCGTGSLAIAAKRRVGASGTVHGIDASPEMIDRAKRKASKAEIDVVFQTAIVEALPFPDAKFDAVMSTLMLHHLPRPAREQCVREIRRVLKPGGRVLAVDFATPARKRGGPLAHIHRHGHLALEDMLDLLRAAGLGIVESGSVGVSDLQFAVAIALIPADDIQQDRSACTSRSLDPLPAPRWLLPSVGIALLAGHGIILRVASSKLTLTGIAALGVGGLLLLMHIRFGGLLNALLRRHSRN